MIGAAVLHPADPAAAEFFFNPEPGNARNYT
jgi:hypothetical protein